MLRRLLSRNTDLQQLADEGYQIEVYPGYLVVRGIPYVTVDKTVSRGDLISDIAIADDVVAPPSPHTAWFTGLNPSDRNGQPLSTIIATQEQTFVDGLVSQHQFSVKPL